MFYLETKVSDEAESDEMDVDSGTDSPPPPPPPPELPQILTTTLNHPITLPNGIELPPGTKQTIVYPYPSNHPYAHEIGVLCSELVTASKEFDASTMKTEQIF